MSVSRKIPSRGIAIKSTKLKPSKLPGLSFASMRTLLGKLPLLLCASLATGAAAQVSALRATSSKMNASHHFTFFIKLNSFLGPDIEASIFNRLALFPKHAQGAFQHFS
jgi:hypothetical protein